MLQLSIVFSFVEKIKVELLRNKDLDKQEPLGEEFHRPLSKIVSFRN